MGDKKYVLPSLLPEFAGKVDLIYIDPPFDTGADFSYNTLVPDSHESFTKEPSMLEQKAYRDTWGQGLKSYLGWFSETLVLLRDLLSENGAVYVHLDYHVVHYAKILLDEVFGPDAFVNEIIWRRKQAAAWLSNQFGTVNDTILFYAKGQEHIFNSQYSREDDNTKKYLEERFIYDDGDGRKYMKSPLINPLPRPNLRYTFHGVQPPPTGWLYSKVRLDDLFAKNELVMPKEKTGRIYRKIYEDTYPGQVIQNLWMDIPIVNPMALERLDYPTQKPEALLDRIIKASSNEGNLVLDCFCGSGTTAAVAEKLSRRWIACDLGRFAIHTTRKRLLGIPDVKPFVVQNLGKYERQQWQVAEFPSNGKDRLAEQKEREAAYRKFILELYHATPVSGHAWLHGVKGGRMVHVAAVDAPVTRADVNAIAAEVWKASGKGPNSPQKPAVDVLGWEFALDMNETAKQVAAEARVDAAFKKIPREVLEKKAVEQGDVYFFELGALSVETKIKKRDLTLTLSDFVIPSDDVPAEVRSAIKHWSQMVDYWAVDWDFKDDTFHNQWQSYRTRKNPKLELSVKHEYEQAGKYTVVVKAIDILGNDTTKMLNVEVK